MADLKHTPGSWSVEPGDSIVKILADGDVIAATGTKAYWQRHDETDLANAHLIAAAPCLFEALAGLRSALAEMDAELHAQNIAVIDLTLAKAKGES